MWTLNVHLKFIGVASWRSFSLVNESRVPRERTELLKVTDKFVHVRLYRVYLVAFVEAGNSKVSSDRHRLNGRCTFNHHDGQNVLDLFIKK